MELTNKLQKALNIVKENHSYWRNKSFVKCENDGYIATFITEENEHLKVIIKAVKNFKFGSWVEFVK